MIRLDQKVKASIDTSQANSRDACLGDLCVFIGLDTTDADSAQTKAIFHDRHAAFQHAVDGGR